MQHDQITQQLNALDFSAHDATVYVALLELAPCRVGPIITKIGLHRNVVYTSLTHLVARKLVSEKLVNGRKEFALASPTVLTAEFEQKTAHARQLATQLEQLIQYGAQEITIHQGNTEYLSLLMSVIKSMPAGSKKYVLGTGGAEFMEQTMLPIWKPYHAVASAQQLQIQMIGYEPQRAAMEDVLKKENMYQVRYLPANLENPAGLHIYPEVDTVLNIIYSTVQQPVTAIKIRNAALVQGYLNLFNNLWQMGKE
ncbi:MAG: hypothetical protein HYV32_00060 [Candidatus Kerfeldbacteria bacterium]|nr:hypothetical protein [Candidatus Kerfeldbacteria bacterium]